MNSNKISLILGLMLILIMSIGSISAEDSLDDSISDMDLSDEGSLLSIDNSNIGQSNTMEDSIDDVKVDVKNGLSSSNLASTYKITEKDGVWKILN